MAFVAGKDGRVCVDHVAFSAYISDWEATQELDVHDVSVLSDSGHKFVAGEDGGSVTIGGPHDNDDSTGGQDETLESMRGTSGEPVSIAPSGFAIGNRVFSCLARSVRYAISNGIGNAVRYQAQFIAEEHLDRAISLHELEAETATGNETSHDGTASSSNGGVGTLHVTAASGTSPTADIKIQHSSDNSTWADLVTFTQATAATAERVEVSGTVNRYLRAVHTLGGTSPSFTYTCSFARR